MQTVKTRMFVIDMGGTFFTALPNPFSSSIYSSQWEEREGGGGGGGGEQMALILYGAK